MKEKITRRSLLTATTVLVAETVSSSNARLVDEIFKVRLDDDPQLSWNELEEFAFRLDRVLKKLPDPNFEINQENVENWIREIAPYFQYERISTLFYTPPAELQDYKLARQHFHTLGTANLAGDITLNARMANPVSVWKNRPDFLSTLTHELAHAQGVWGETDAQVVTTEVLAAGANHGNKKMFYATVEHLRDMTIGSLFYIAVSADSIPFFDRFYKKLSPDAFSQARYEKSKRYWTDKDQLKNILWQYNWLPMQILGRSLRYGETYAVDIPINHKPPPSPNEMELEETEPEEQIFSLPEPLLLDDTAYLLKNLESMAKWAKKENQTK